MRVTRRRFLAGLAGGGLGAVATAGGYARWVEPELFEVSHWRVPLATSGAQSGRPLRVLHLSDFHASDVVPFTLIAEAIALGLAERPDLILLTGDYYTGRFQGWREYRPVLAPLAPAAPTFAVFGNHDGELAASGVGGWPRRWQSRALFANAGITVMENTVARLTVAGREVELFGVGDLWTGECDPARAFAGRERRGADDRTLRLVLNHNPDAKTLFADYDWDVMLCGHTHGGQFRLPLIGAVHAPVQDMAYVEGLNPWRDRLIYTTRGVGNLHGVRFNCPPEVSILDIG